MAIRKLWTGVEDVLLEGGRPVKRPYRVAAAAAVVTNPLAGAWHESLDALVDEYCDQLGELLAMRVVDALGDDPIEAYGKAAIVGTAGEVEHGSAIIHNLRFGNAFRTRVGDATTLLPAVEKRALPGAVFDVPLKHVADPSMRSHHQTIELRIADAPQAGEIVIALVGAISGRPQERLVAFGTGTGEQPCSAPAGAGAAATVAPDLLAEAERVFPGGVLGSFALPPDVAFVPVAATGAHLRTADGRELVDYVLGGGPMLLGHGHPEVVAATVAQVERGVQLYSYLNEPAIRLAATLVDAIPCAEQRALRDVGRGGDDVRAAVPACAHGTRSRGEDGGRVPRQPRRDDALDLAEAARCRTGQLRLRRRAGHLA